MVGLLWLHASTRLKLVLLLCCFWFHSLLVNLKRMSVAKLIPLLDVDDETDTRPMLRLYCDTPVIIGRNSFNTAIERKEVSRELLKLEWRDGALHVMALKEKHSVRVRNEPLAGKTVLNHGDVLSLWNDSYSYQVRYSEVSTISSELSSTAKRKLTDHVACPICMELMIDAMILVPCGHRFCGQCCMQLECASCRTTIQSKVKDRYLNNFVLDLVQERCLDADDSANYLKRLGKEVRRIEPLVGHAVSRFVLTLRVLHLAQPSESTVTTALAQSRKRRKRAPASKRPTNAEVICLI
jgi:hypothetical protein